MCSVYYDILYSSALFLHIILTVLKSSFVKLKTKETCYRGYKKFSSNLFKADLALSLDGKNKDYDSIEDAFMKTVAMHASIKIFFTELMKDLF